MIIRAPYSLHHVAWIVPGALSFLAQMLQAPQRMVQAAQQR
jgi:hypothetical protein